MVYTFCDSILGRYGLSGLNWIGGIAMLIGLVLVGIVIYLLVHNSRNTASGHTSDAPDILKERLARGEIDEDTYERLLKKVN